GCAGGKAMNWRTGPGNDVSALLAEFRAGLEAEVALLRQLEAVAIRQRENSAAADYERFSVESDRRDGLTRSLVAIESGLVPLRKQLAGTGAATKRLDGYDNVVALRREAIELASRILATDQASMKALADADLARKAALASLARGETTLAAYC